MFEMETTAYKSYNISVIEKSNDKANEARITGNDRFQAKNYLFALNHYNRSLAYAKSKSVAALTYGNRSAVFFNVQLYKECLENIQLARENGYPANKLSKLIEREAKCKELMTAPKTDAIWDFFKLSYPANEKIPWIVDCVEMKWTEKYGRGIYAKQDLKAGDIICVEDAFFNYTFFDKYNTYFHCYNCFDSNKMNLIPCDKTASMMFCSTACKEDFYSKALNIDKMLDADVKLLSDIAGFFGSVKAFDDYINRTDLKTLNKTIFDYDLSNSDDPEYKDKLMNCFLSLCTNKNRPEENFHIRKCLSEKASHHLLSIYNLNQGEMRLDDGERNMMEIGRHISLFSSLINHCCYNNAFSMNVGNKIVTILQKPVKVGEQVFYRYGSRCFLFVFGMRKGAIEEKHMFKCDCEACGQNHETLTANCMLGAGMNDNKILYQEDPIHEGDYDKAKRELKKHFDDINENPDAHKNESIPLMRCETILKSAAYLCGYPFQPYRGY